MHPSSSESRGECNVGIGTWDAEALLGGEPARLHAPGYRFSHRYRPPRFPLATKQWRVHTDAGLAVPEGGTPRVLDVLPSVETPGTDLLGGEPTARSSGGNGGQGWHSSHLASEFFCAKASQRHAMRAR